MLTFLFICLFIIKIRATKMKIGYNLTLKGNVLFSTGSEIVLEYQIIFLGTCVITYQLTYSFFSVLPKIFV